MNEPSRRTWSAIAAFSTGWFIGALLSVLEFCAALLAHGLRLSLSGALLTIGILPYLFGTVGIVIYAVPFMRSPSRIRGAVLLIALFPWLLARIFPLFTIPMLAMGANIPKILGVLILTLLIMRESIRWTRPWRALSPSRPVIFALPLIALALYMLMGIRHPPLEDQLPRSADVGSGGNILLVTIDTLRGDELGIREHGENSPTIDSLAASGISFSNCMSNAPWTLASISSFMTGLYPSSTGVFTGQQRLSNRAVTLAEYLKEAGYHTHAILSNLWLRPQFGLAQGFDVYDHRRPDDTPDPTRSFLLHRFFARSAKPSARPVPESATDLVDTAAGFLHHHTGGRFFLWIHFNDLHDPYEPPPQFQPVTTRHGMLFRPSSGRIVNLRLGKRISSAERDHLRGLYRGELRYVDSELRRLFQHLRSAGMSEKTLVVLAADHGEEFWEHGSVGHGHTMYGELLHVPLMFSNPSTIEPGLVRDDPVTMVDMLPTVVKWSGLEPDKHLPGMNLLDGETPFQRRRYAEGLEFFEEKKAVSTGGWKLILSEETRSKELYDLVEDSLETSNMVRFEPERAESLEYTLGTHLSRCRALRDSLRMSRAEDQTTAMSRELKEMLRAQGYLE